MLRNGSRPSWPIRRESNCTHPPAGCWILSARIRNRRAPLGIGGAALGQQLDSDHPLQSRIPRLVDDTHAALADLLQQIEVAQSGGIHVRTILSRRKPKALAPAAPSATSNRAHPGG